MEDKEGDPERAISEPTKMKSQEVSRGDSMKSDVEMWKLCLVDM